ncbi:MAG: Type 1 glutamine amidotransferase-like domain-containing protein [Kosmotogaceae bacterium]
MTTYLLHGGETSRDNSQNDYFFKHFTALVNKNSVKILLCYLSQEKAKWDKSIQRDKPKITNKTNKKVSFDIAESAEDLLSKIEENDVLYVAGGQPDLLEPYYTQLKGLREKLKDKVYIGSSMGTYMVSENYFTMQYQTIHQGMGILPIQTICHWDQIEDREHKLSLLKENSKSMVLVLNECQTVEIYQ